MKCPFCGYLDSKVTDSRTMDENAVIRRRRMCETCGAKFTTYERLDTISITVIKKNGSREEFSRDKIFKSISHSCDKRNISAAQIEEITASVENALLNSMRKEIGTQEIGELVMNEIKKVDEVAYVRFASVYRQFKDIDSFIEEIGRMRLERADD